MKQKISVAVFRRDEWYEIKAVCSDLQETFDEWHAAFISGLADMGLSLDEVAQVTLTAKMLRDWQRTRGRKIKSNDKANRAAKIHKETEINGTRH